MSSRGWRRRKLARNSGAAIPRLISAFAVAAIAFFSQVPLGGQEVDRQHLQVVGTASYTRAFGGGGPGFTVAPGLFLSSRMFLGARGTVAWPELESVPGHRTLMMAGLQLGYLSPLAGRGPAAFALANLLLLRSSVPDRSVLVDPLPVPRYDRVGTEAGAGVGVSVGVLLHLTRRIRGTLGAELVHQELYGNERNLLWLLGAGVVFR